MGGPSVFPEIPKEMDVRGGWKRNESEDQKTRRSIYTFVRRNSRYPMFQAFDMPDTHESCSRRAVTTTAPQALNLLNDRTILISAQSFAGRVLKEAGADVNRQIALAYRLAFARAPEADERRMAINFLDQQSDADQIQNRGEAARGFAVELRYRARRDRPGPRGGAGRFLPCAVQLERVRLCELKFRGIKMDRRDFVKHSIATATFTVGATAGMSVKSYSRVIGANDRIRLGGIGPGDRGSGRVDFGAEAGRRHRRALRRQQGHAGTRAKETHRAGRKDLR